MNAKTRVYATSRFEYLADALCKEGAFDRGKLINSTFPNGEVRLEILDVAQARDAEVILLGGTEREDLFDLLMYAGELAQLAGRLNILIPFYRYATQERKDKGKEGHIVIAKGIARALSSLPLASRGNRVFLLDPHTHSLAQYFDDTRIRAEILRSTTLVTKIIREEILGSNREAVICSVDDGRPDSVIDVAKALDVPFALIDKERLSGTSTRVLGEVNGDVKGKIAVMVDDMVRTLGSAEGAANAYLKAGAAEVWLVASHADYAPGAIEKLRASGTVQGVITSDSYPSFALADGEFARVHSVARLLSETLSQQYGL